MNANNSPRSANDRSSNVKDLNNDLSDAEGAIIDYKKDENFEILCKGKGKSDDITVVSLWISHRYNH